MRCVVRRATKTGCQSVISVVCELGQVFSVGIHDIDILVESGECDALAVGRPRPIPGSARVVCESGQVFSVGIHHIESPVSVAVGLECDALAVGRPRRMPVPVSGQCGL